MKLALADFTNSPQLQSLIDRLQDLGPIDFLFNNAGFGARGDSFNDSFENQRRMLQAYIRALNQITPLVTGITFEVA